MSVCVYAYDTDVRRTDGRAGWTERVVAARTEK